MGGTMKAIVVGLWVAATPALATDDITYATGDGQIYVLVMGDGEATLAPETDPADIYTLKPDCTAVHADYGTGTWGYANGGWLIDIGGATKVGFPRQEAPFDAPACEF
jgi:hypothetical protein